MGAVSALIYSCLKKSNIYQVPKLEMLRPLRKLYGCQVLSLPHHRGSHSLVQVGDLVLNLCRFCINTHLHVAKSQVWTRIEITVFENFSFMSARLNHRLRQERYHENVLLRQPLGAHIPNSKGIRKRRRQGPHRLRNLSNDQKLDRSIDVPLDPVPLPNSSMTSKLRRVAKLRARDICWRSIMNALWI